MTYLSGGISFTGPIRPYRVGGFIFIQIRNALRLVSGCERHDLIYVLRKDVSNYFLYTYVQNGFMFDPRIDLKGK